MLNYDNHMKLFNEKWNKLNMVNTICKGPSSMHDGEHGKHLFESKEKPILHPF